MGFELERKLDYSDLEATPADGRRYELVHGILHVTASPRSDHQRASRELMLQLIEYFHSRQLGEVFHAPIDLILTRHDVLVPDLVVVSDSKLVSQRGIEGPPLLVVEILSPSTRQVDQGVKARRYAELGVEHFWVVDPDRRSLECHRRYGDAFRIVAEARGAAVLTHPAWDGLSIDLARLWGDGMAPPPRH
jgi:Uma2 family endonuclease